MTWQVVQAQTFRRRVQCVRHFAAGCRNGYARLGNKFCAIRANIAVRKYGNFYHSLVYRFISLSIALTRLLAIALSMRRGGEVPRRTRERITNALRSSLIGMVSFCAAMRTTASTRAFKSVRSDSFSNSPSSSLHCESLRSCVAPQPRLRAMRAPYACLVRRCRR